MNNENNLLPSLIRKVSQMENTFREFIDINNEGLYSVSEFSKLTGLDDDTVTNYCKRQSLAAVQVIKGGKWMILRSEFKRLVTEAIENNQGKLRSTARRDAKILNHLGISK
ncbi:MAG: helix-turn-helix domain-containing protein [Reichenbachiella sp.]|uniref:helix-turn-helix domain-containing protein n=1 Tax=Reichenbachiella sp. TaxID=2184521 RepID=UPI00329A0B52